MTVKELIDAIQYMLHYREISNDTQIRIEQRDAYLGDSCIADAHTVFIQKDRDTRYLIIAEGLD